MHRSKPKSAFKWINHAYFKAALIPLLLAELSLLAVYIISNQQTLNSNTNTVTQLAESELLRHAERESTFIDQQLQAIKSNTLIFQQHAIRAHQTPYQSTTERNNNAYDNSDTAYYSKNNIGGAALYYTGASPIGAKEREKAEQLAQLDPLMKDLQHYNELVVQSYYCTFDSMVRIYPFLDVLKTFPVKMHLPSYKFYYLADQQHNPQKKAVWTGVYKDMAGLGWMVSSLAPVYNGDFLQGVVAQDVTVDKLIEQILTIELPWHGYAMLLDQQGRIIAMPEQYKQDWDLNALRDTDSARQGDALADTQFNIHKRPDTQQLSERMHQDSSGIVQLDMQGQQFVAWSTIAETNWQLIFVIPHSEIILPAKRLATNGQHLFYIMITSLTAFYCVFFAFIYWRSRRMSERLSIPLIRIRNMAKNITEGDFQQKYFSTSIEEVDDTVSAIIKMGEDLGLQKNELENARQKALKASELKTQFIASTSHELRTPLNGIIASNDLLALTLLDDNQQQLVDLSLSSSIQLNRIISDILDYSILEKGRLNICHTPFSIRDLITRIIHTQQTHANKKNLSLKYSVADDLANTFYGDEARIYQILSNLIANAIKFTEHGEVCLDVRSTHQQPSSEVNTIKFLVSDTGMGIKEESLTTILDPFVQVDGAIDRRHSGVGLGLSITKQLINLMQGSMNVSSVFGEGTSFIVTLPLKKLDNTLAQKTPIETKDNDALPTLTQKCHVLIVDDNPVNQLILKAVLSKLGADSQIVSNGRDAINLADEMHFDFIMLDIQMPGLSGIETMHEIKKLANYKSSPAIIIAVTANVMAGDSEGYISQGMNDYIAKPIRPNIIQQVLQKWLDKRDQSDN